MKLRSKAQEAIISLMKEGWRLYDRRMMHPECDFDTSVQAVSITALERKGLIVWKGEQYHLASENEQK